MPPEIIALLCVHVLAGIVWAGATFALARTGGAGMERLFMPQMTAAALAFLSGAGLWAKLHPGPPGAGEWALIAGMVSAALALALQLVLRRHPAQSNLLAMPLLALAAVTMIAARAG